MNTIDNAFDFKEYGTLASPGYTKSSGCIILDMNTDFMRKSRRLKNGYLIYDPDTSNFS